MTAGAGYSTFVENGRRISGRRARILDLNHALAPWFAPLSIAPERTTMPLTLAAAAKLAGIDKSTLRRAVRAGKLSAARDDNGVWQIEACEVGRLYALAAPGSERPEDNTTALPHDAAPDAAVVTTDALVAELRSVIADLRQDRDAWRDQAQRLSLPKPETPPVGWRWWRRAG